VAGSVVRRVGAAFGLLVILAAGVVVLGGSAAALLTLVVGDDPAEEEARIEAADVELVRCAKNLRRMTAGLLVTNRSSMASDYFIDLEFVRRVAPEDVEVVSVVLEDVAPGGSRRESVTSLRPPRAGFGCRVGDVDRFAR
jgi:hypothetical protein